LWTSVSARSAKVAFTVRLSFTTPEFFAPRLMGFL
jgi:hypothetical protein